MYVCRYIWLGGVVHACVSVCACVHECVCVCVYMWMEGL